MPTSTSSPAVLAPPRGWGVGAAVPSGTFAGLGDEELLVELETHERMKAWIEARGIAVVEELARRREREALAELDERDRDALSRTRTLVVVGVREAVVDEVALATGAGQRAAETRVRMAREWERFTPVREALAAGRMSWSRAVQVSTRTSEVDSGRMRRIVEKVLAPYIPGPGGDSGGLEVPQSVFSWRLGRAVAAVTTSRQRHEDAIARRDAWAVINPDADGTMTLTGTPDASPPHSPASTTSPAACAARATPAR
ncbi:hypothetical protein [Mobilicoccus caccae]|uniref:DUF222 domain-containing protein n=1 Tax=Mobilicoccus caccae TaxID=1859295 RepID=A0ABQ6INB6_9MICO|nr:hypothetical protein [Mobilicoccus caccae]GMA39414.1 hypothetical protein GCM10025883_14590 [Mobilicoccus caccae]